ncbi:MAG: NAD(P)/FAD-dependent oxidoreductase [Clostridia bacterium]|nr:NAD(P)/FAD-dependent oxidoreductase [Clostridia bacterium]
MAAEGIAYYDAAVIGAGVAGAMTARELSRYDLKICILEKENDVAMGASRANSAIVHAGFDAKEGTLKAKLNVKGSEMMSRVAQELGVKYKNNGSLVIAFDEKERSMIEKLLIRGNNNGVRGLRIVEREELRRIEPNISEKAICALYAPTGAIICPYELTAAAVGNAMDNGAELLRNFEVTGIEKKDDVFEISSGSKKISARIVINAAGLYADKIAAMVGDTSFSIHPRRGEYILLDKECGAAAVHTVFRTPTEKGKGILVTPTVDGNLLTGPTSVDMTDKEDKSTTDDGLARVKRETSESIPSIPFAKTITSFCGLRAVGSTGDFIITSPVRGFINAAGIESPGLSASPAIAEFIRNMLLEQGFSLKLRKDYNPVRPPMHGFACADTEEKNRIIKENPAFGRIVCRCERVTEGEILEAIRRNPGARDVDGVKRRTRSGMGRCQGGFCSPRIMEILADELKLPFEAVTKSGGASLMCVGKTKEGR